MGAERSPKLNLRFMDLELLEPPALNSVVEPVVPSRTMEHHNLRRDDFWSAIPAYAETTADEFHTHTFQARHSVTNIRQLRDTLRHLAPDSFYDDVARGIRRAPMALRISPYLLSLIDWRAPYKDP